MIYTTSYLDGRTCEPCSFFQHVLWSPNTQVLLDPSLHPNDENITNTHYT